MDFKENLNESYDLEYQEISETGDPVLILKDIENNVNYTFYPEDVKKLEAFLNRLRKFGVI
jgi:hypothetical protein